MVVGALDVQTEVLVIGAGPGGYVAALRASQLGKEVILVDKEKELGGICLNTGCIPTKALIHASNLYKSIEEMKKVGIEIDNYKLNIDSMRDWKNNILSKLNQGIVNLCKKSGVEVIQGKAVFVSDDKVRIEGKTDISSISFKNCIISTGSIPVQLKGFEYDRKVIVTSDEALALTNIPEKLVIIGGGYIGTEMGTVYGKLGSEVHIIEATDRLIPQLDKEIVSVVASKIKDFNVNVHYNSRAISCEVSENKGLVKIDEDGKEATLEADMVLVVVGRKPNTLGLGLENTSVKLNDKGFIEVNEEMKTSCPSIFAVGDVVGQPMLAHKASREGKVAAEVIAGLPSAFDNKVIPFVVFNDPEIASVGLTEEQAIAEGYECIIGRFPFSALGRAMTLNKTEGFIKFVAEKETGLVLGMHATGPGASDIVSEATLGIEMSATLEDISATIHPHPTLPEGLMEAAEVTLGKGIHIFTPKK